MNAGTLFKPALLVLILLNSCSAPQKTTNLNTPTTDQAWLAEFLKGKPGMDSVLARKEELGIQIIYTRIDRDKKGRPSLAHHSYGVNNEQYFYPASTVKFPIAILALQKLNELNIPGLNMNTTMITGTEGPRQTAVNNDPSAADGRPNIAHYIKKILLVSDNDAFNRLYEFLGQEYINKSLHEMGYEDIQIIHRLSISLSDEDNRHTNPIRFIDTSGNIIYEQPARKSMLQYATRNTKMGKGFMRGDELVNQPFDFSMKNRMTLPALHSILQSIIFPGTLPANKQFKLTETDYTFLRTYMSMRPGESVSPVYSSPDNWDNLVKILYYGTEKTTPETNIRIFNKTGTAYGFLSDAAYIIDHEKGIEFMLTAVMYCNSDGIFNDDKYDYNRIGYPFFKQLGRIMYDHEVNRKRNYLPDFSSLRFTYDKNH